MLKAAGAGNSKAKERLAYGYLVRHTALCLEKHLFPAWPHTFGTWTKVTLLCLSVYLVVCVWI